ncbi:hypothetical protein AGENTSMITH_188 [Bacillus phage vB_BspM_AgentSmith]|nr:hypothetical protein AGENTSMITH_188 [Bacillus phage vB_BspM_AgentSmith]
MNADLFIHATITDNEKRVLFYRSLPVFYQSGDKTLNESIVREVLNKLKSEHHMWAVSTGIYSSPEAGFIGDKFNQFLDLIKPHLYNPTGIESSELIESDRYFRIWVTT